MISDAVVAVLEENPPMVASDIYRVLVEHEIFKSTDIEKGMSVDDIENVFDLAVNDVESKQWTLLYEAFSWLIKKGVIGYVMKKRDDPDADVFFLTTRKTLPYKL
jgi:hypothetical protein